MPCPCRRMKALENACRICENCVHYPRVIEGVCINPFAKSAVGLVVQTGRTGSSMGRGL